MDLLQMIRQLQYLDVRKEIVRMMELMNDLLKEHLEPLKMYKMDHFDRLEHELRWLVVPVYHQLDSIIGSLICAKLFD